MACRGAHFSLSDDEAQCLRNLREEQRLRHVTDVIEETFFRDRPTRVAESDKAWDAIHRALTDGRLECSETTYPLNLLILGGEHLSCDTDYLLSLKTPQQVQDVARILPGLNEAEFSRRYFTIDSADYEHGVDELDRGYSWEGFKDIRDFWLRVASEGRWILFSVDQ